MSQSILTLTCPEMRLILARILMIANQLFPELKSERISHKPPKAHSSLLTLSFNCHTVMIKRLILLWSLGHIYSWFLSSTTFQVLQRLFQRGCSAGCSFRLTKCLGTVMSLPQFISNSQWTPNAAAACMACEPPVSSSTWINMSIATIGSNFFSDTKSHSCTQSDFLLTFIPGGKHHRPWWCHLISNNCFCKLFFINNNLAMTKTWTSGKSIEIVLSLSINSSWTKCSIQWQYCVITYAW